MDVSHRGSATVAGELGAPTSDQVTQMLTSLGARGIDGEQLSIVERPVTASAMITGVGLVHVSVWSIMTVAAPGVGVGRQAWRTVEVDMRLVDSRWLVDGWTSTPGPTPALSPEAAVSSTAEIVERLAWPSRSLIRAFLYLRRAATTGDRGARATRRGGR